jgi:hypothetical protein
LKPASRLLLLLVLITAAQQSWTTEAADCASIEDDARRLACFDASVSGKAIPQMPSAPSAPPPPPPAAEPSSSPPVAAESPVAPSGDTSAAPETGFMGDEKIDLTTTIEAIHAGEKQKMVFLLANDQVWIQATPRPLPFEVGDTVSVRNATLGGYFMRSEKGTSTRVQRVR